MERPRPIEPLGFFTRDALAAGWHFTWRVWLYTVPFWLIPSVLSFFIISTGGSAYVGTIVFCLGVSAAFGAFIRRSGRVASRWAEARWGHELPEQSLIWWGILWRAVAVAFAAGVVLSPVTIVATRAGRGGGGFVLSLLALAQLVAAIMGTGWAMSRIVAGQLAGLEPVTAPSAAPQSAGAPPRAAPQPAPAKGSAAPGEKPRCPKCGLDQTEHGAVIGWYCKVCGWRGSRR